MAKIGVDCHGVWCTERSDFPLSTFPIKKFFLSIVFSYTNELGFI